MTHGRPKGSPNKIDKDDLNQRVAALEQNAINVQNELAALRAMLPAVLGSDRAESYAAGAETAKKLLGKKS